MPKTIILAGSSGLIGSHLLQLCLESTQVAKVICLNRRKVLGEHPKLEERIIDFNHLVSLPDFPEADAVCCCLGTTMKKAGSKEAFRKVDYHYTLDLGKAARNQGIPHLLLVSSLGASTQTSNFYLKTKGEIEEALNRLAFPSLTLLRPSFLLGERKENRVAENIGKWIFQTFGFLLAGPLKKYKAIHANTVARAMLNSILKEKPGTMILESDRVAGLGKESISIQD